MLQKNVPDVSYIMDAAQGSVVAQRFFSDDGKPRPKIEIIDGREFVSSTTVAKLFRMNHNKLLWNLSVLLYGIDEDFRKSNFFMHEDGSRQPCCLMTRAGFEKVCPEKDAPLKEAVLRAFDDAERSAEEKSVPEAIPARESEIEMVTVGGRAFVSSRTVAVRLGKSHSGMLDSIRRRIGKRPDSLKAEFVASEYVDAHGERRPCYLMSRRGFEALMEARGYRGNAVAVEDAFRRAFEKAEASIAESESASAPVPATAEIAVSACPDSMAAGEDAPHVETAGGRPVVTSLEVARFFKKEHKNVMRKIRAVIADYPEDYCQLNFELTSRDVPGPKGGMRKAPCYLLTKTAIRTLASRFAGKKYDIMMASCMQRLEDAEAALAGKTTSEEKKAVEALPASGQFATTTLELAERFGKGHLDVSKAVHELMMRCPEDIRMRNFEAFRHVNGTAQTAYRLSRMAAAVVAMSFERTITYEKRVRYLDAMLAPEGVPAAAAALPEAKAVEALPPVSEASETPPALPAASPVVSNGVRALDFDGVPVRFRREWGVLWIAGTDMVAALGMAPIFQWKQYRIPKEAVRRLDAQDGMGNKMYYCTIPAAIRFCSGGRPEFAKKRLEFLEWLAHVAIPAIKGEEPVATAKLETPTTAAPVALTSGEIAAEYRGTLIRILPVDGEPWTRKLDMLKALGFSTHRRFEIPREFETRACSNDGAIYVSARGVEYFCSHGSPARIERGKAFLQWLKGEALPSAAKNGMEAMA